MLPYSGAFSFCLSSPILLSVDLHVQASGCSLNPLGWCCFGTLCCVALPLSWLPFVCAFCKQQCQRPVYGYPMDCLTVSFIAAAEDAWTKQKASTSPLPPSIHCMDSTLVESLAVQQDQGQWQQQQDACVALHMRCTPSPPPMSIFIPPSAVPACKRELAWSLQPVLASNERNVKPTLSEAKTACIGGHVRIHSLHSNVDQQHHTYDQTCGGMALFNQTCSSKAHSHSRCPPLF